MVAPFEAERFTDLSDADLVTRFKRGDNGALEILLQRHSDALYRYCYHLVGNAHDAEDIAQESIARAIMRVDTLQSGGAFRSWLFRIARNLSMDAFRSGKRLMPMPDEDVTPLPSFTPSPYEHVALGEEHQTVAEALGKLAMSHQRVLWMREVEGLSYAEIAERLDVSQSAVETLLFRARKRLREEYTKRDRPVAGLAALAGLRKLVHRLAHPLTGAPLAAKVGVSLVVVAGTVMAVPRIAPVHAGVSGSDAPRSTPGATATRHPSTGTASRATRQVPATGDSPRVVASRISLPAHSGPRRAAHFSQPDTHIHVSRRAVAGTAARVVTSLRPNHRRGDHRERVLTAVAGAASQRVTTRAGSVSAKHASGTGTKSPSGSAAQRSVSTGGAGGIVSPTTSIARPQSLKTGVSAPASREGRQSAAPPPTRSAGTSGSGTTRPTTNAGATVAVQPAAAAQPTVAVQPTTPATGSTVAVPTVQVQASVAPVRVSVPGAASVKGAVPTVSVSSPPVKVAVPTGTTKAVPVKASVPTVTVKTPPVKGTVPTVTVKTPPVKGAVPTVTTKVPVAVPSVGAPKSAVPKPTVAAPSLGPLP